MLIVEDKDMDLMVNTLFPIEKQKILGANLADFVLPYYNYDNVKKAVYTNSSSSNASKITFPGELTDFSQIVLLVASTGNRDIITESGFGYFIYSPHICSPNVVIDGTRYIECISVPHTSYTKVNVPDVKIIASTDSNEYTSKTFINPETFLTDQKRYYITGSGNFGTMNYGLVPGKYGTAVLWYLPYSYNVKEV